VIAAPFGDKNEKGSKTGIERSIETFELDQASVLLCLVRAFVETKKGKVRKENIDPQSGIANRMKLYCYLFKEFARARASGSPWEYTWELMLADLEADDLFAEWWVAHQTELAGDVSDQVETEPGEETQEGEAREEAQEEAELPGWADSADAYEQGERLMQALVDANYSGVEVALRPIDGRYSVVYKVLAGEGGELVLSSEVEITYLIEQAELGQL
jgi:hypothetical protein